MGILCFGSTSRCGDPQVSASVRVIHRGLAVQALLAVSLGAQVAVTTSRPDLREPSYLELNRAARKAKKPMKASAPPIRKAPPTRTIVTLRMSKPIPCAGDPPCQTPRNSS
jgi:hypothetical protein